MLDTSLLTVLEGGCKERLRELGSNSIDVVITSPPYAQQRKRDYVGVSISEYIPWFIPIGLEIKRVLKPTGSFFLNLFPHCSKGERLLYVDKLKITLAEIAGFKYIDEYIWYKSATPGICGPRLRSSWEPVYHFAKEVPYMDHNNIRIPSNSTFGNQRGWASLSVTGNLGGFHDICDQTKGTTEPDNVLYFPTSLLVKDGEYKHPAKFPYELPLFLLKAFCPSGGTVCDPFAGSGTTALAALILGHRCTCIEVSPDYCHMIEQRVAEYSPPQPKKMPSGYRDLFPD